MEPPSSFVNTVDIGSPVSSTSRGAGAAIGIAVIVLLCILFAGWWFWPSGSCSGCSGSGSGCSGCSGSGCCSGCSGSGSGSGSCSGCSGSCSGCSGSGSCSGCSGSKSPSGSTTADGLMDGVSGPIRGQPHDWEAHDAARLATAEYYDIPAHQTGAVNAMHSSASDRWTGADPAATMAELQKDATSASPAAVAQAPPSSIPSGKVSLLKKKLRQLE